MSELLGLRPQVYAFARLMEATLQRNDSKRHWREVGLSATFGHLLREVEELRDELMTRSRRGEVVLEATDVACLAMMVADIMGGLDAVLEDVARSAPASRAEGVEEVIQVAAGAIGVPGDKPDVRSMRRDEEAGGPSSSPVPSKPGA